MNQLIQITCLGVLLLLSNCNKSEEERLLYDGITSSHQQSILMIEKQNEAMLNYFNITLSKESKVKYLPIHYALDTLLAKTAEMKSYVGSVKQTNAETDSADMAANLLNQLLLGEANLKKHLKDFMTKNREMILQLTEEELKKELTLFEKSIAITQNITALNLNQLSTIELNLRSSQLLLALTLLEEKLITSLTYYAFGGGCRFYHAFPKVLPLQSSIAKGETFEALIFFYDDYYDHEIPLVDQIVVDGVALPLIDGKYVHYKSQPIWGKEKFITISYSAYNEATGNLYRAADEYFYRIIPK